MLRLRDASLLAWAAGLRRLRAPLVTRQAPLRLRRFAPVVEKHIAAAKAAAGTEHAGLFDAVCTTARNVIAQASAPPRAGGPGRGGASRRPARPPRRARPGTPSP